jgi:hypothetical protein
VFRRTPNGLVGALGLVVVVVVAGVARSASDVGEAAEGQRIMRAPDINFPNPLIEVLPGSLDVPGTSLSLRAPGDRASAEHITGSAAVEKAEAEFGPSAFPEKVTASLAWEKEGGRLVWAVSFEGICVPEAGPPGFPHDPCATNEWLVIVDATTGSVAGMVSYRTV